MTKIVELRPDKNFMNTHFEKYQFCTDAIPTFEIKLKEDIYRLELNSNQESLLEARLFAFHNHLFENPYDGSCWFVDKNWMVWRLTKNGSLEQVHSMHNRNTDATGVLYNPSIGFTKNNVVVISDGGSCLTFLKNNKKDCAKVHLFNDIEPGIILDVQYVETTDKIIVAMCAIKNISNKKFNRILLLTYTWKNIEDKLELISTVTLRVQGAIEYMHIESNGDYIHSISQDSITFENKLQESDKIRVESCKASEIQIPKYCWSQDEDSLTIWIKVDKEDKDEIKTDVTSTTLSVMLNDTVLIQGECQHRIDEMLTTNKYEYDKFKLELVKSEIGIMWSKLIKGDNSGVCLPNEALAAEIHSRLGHLCTDQTGSNLKGQPCIGFNAEQLEECDIDGRDNLLQRISLVTQETTHLAMLGINNHLLFSHKTTCGQIICLRQDHDGCVWETRETDNDQWAVTNICTFPGFGYVEASKTNKRFCLYPVDGSYVAILEHARHILLYEKPASNTKISKQWIVDLGCDSSPIMGAVATPQHLIVLTKDKIYRLEVYS